MKFRALAAFAACAAVGVALTPAQATPYAGQFHYLTTGTIAVRGADGAQWMLALTATTSGPLESRPEQRLYVDLNRCVGGVCTAAGRWARPLTSTEVAITPATAVADLSNSKATLRTVLGGVRLEVKLDGEGVGGGAFDGLGSSTSPPGIGPAFAQYTVASGRLAVAGISCGVTGSGGAEIGRIVTVDTVGDDVRDPRVAPPAHLPTGFLTGKARPSCR